MASRDVVELQLDLGFAGDDSDDWFDALVAINQRWLGNYARVNPTFGVSLSLLERNSLWMNTYFQKQRMITSPLSKQAKALLQQHQQTVLMRLRSGGGSRLSEAEGSTMLVEPMAALMFAASVDRCPEYQIESLLSEAMELLQCHSLREQALRAGFAGCVFRFLTTFSELTKRVLALQLLVLLASHDASAVVHACKVASQGQLWQPNMYIYTLQKRHHDHEEIRELAAELITHFATEMPVTSPIHLDSTPYDETEAYSEERLELAPMSPSSNYRLPTLPALASPSAKKPAMSPHRPTTTISSLYVGTPSPYSRNVILPIARPPPSAAEQARRSHIYSTPKEKAVAGDRKRRCLTPNIQEIQREPSEADDLGWMGSQAGSPPRSPTSPRAERKPVAISDKYMWNPECINSVSGFEWWWRSLPQHHSNLEPTQKLKMVTKAAVRLHTKGEWERAVELYLLALSMDVNDEVQFRLRVNLGCAYEVGHEFRASEAEFKAALGINPEDPYARFKLGTALKEQGKFDEAKDAYEAVLHVYPQAEDALKELEHARAELLRQEEAERAALASARTARSPSKPGRRLHSRGTNTSLPRISQPSSPATSPRQPLCPRLEPSSTSPRAPIPWREDDPQSTDLISCVVTRGQQKKVDLRDALRQIDVESTGQIRLAALVKLVSALCDVEEQAVHGWLPHASVVLDSSGLVHYKALLEAVEIDAEKKSSQLVQQTANWKDIVEEIKLEEAAFDDAVKKSKDDVETEQVSEGDQSKQLSEDTCQDLDVIIMKPPSDESEFQAASEGPSASDLQGDEVDTIIRSVDLTPLPPQVSSCEGDEPKKAIQSSTRADIEELGGYHSVSARLDEKREKARQDAILRAERSRVVARKHLHCLRALKEIAVHARNYLLKQYEARELPKTVEADVSSGSTTGESEAIQTEQQVAREPQSIQIGEQAAQDITPPAEDDEAIGGIVEIADDEPIRELELSVMSRMCQQLVDIAMAAAARNVAISRDVAELQALATAMSAVGMLVPEILAQAARANADCVGDDVLSE